MAHPDERYRGEDRRNPSNHQILVEMMTKVSGEIAGLNERFENHLSKESHLEDLFKSAFPNDDPVGHREYHDQLIEAAKAKRVFWEKMVFELSKWGLVGFLGWGAIELWHAFLRGPK